MLLVFPGQKKHWKDLQEAYQPENGKARQFASEPPARPVKAVRVFRSLQNAGLGFQGARDLKCSRSSVSSAHTVSTAYGDAHSYINSLCLHGIRSAEFRFFGWLEMEHNWPPHSPIPTAGFKN